MLFRSGNHHMTGDKIYSGDILSPIGHKHIECTTNTCSEKNGGADYVNVFKSKVIHFSSKNSILD